ncbi:MAG: hypothetical protein M5U34_02375 [Chloroflexi bacterium]|nr:hypothetical protein [Chloroflexota bacterium]
MEARLGEKAEVAPIPAELADEAEIARLALVEAAAEEDDTLLEKFFEDEELTDVRNHYRHKRGHEARVGDADSLLRSRTRHRRRAYFRDVVCIGSGPQRTCFFCNHEKRGGSDLRCQR